ncbi:MAG: Gfo/Idh/MocA family oxidoreductase, partial [Candidatus Heimdallarchaeota archaeon]|nr:Gfo/Idh/MocA family oxidoreductase [Candidatus Heimdallarchaeota archaeon]
MVIDDTNIIKVGVIGTGFGYSVQWPAFVNHPLFEPIAISGQNAKKTKVLGKKLNAKYITSNWQEIIDNPEVDLVSITTPPHLHKEMAIAALKANKHVLCEKPLALSVADAEEMCDVADESGLVAMIDLEFRFLPERLYFTELVNNGYIGDLYNVDITVNSSVRINPRHQGYNWWSERKQGGGVLYALGSHYLDFLLHSFGNINTVSGRTTTNIKKRLSKIDGKMKPVTSDDYFNCILEFQNEGIATVKISTTSGFGRGARVEAYGSEGVLIIDEHRNLYGGKIGEDDLLKKIDLPTGNFLEKVDTDHNLV